MQLQPDQVFAAMGGITFGAVDAFGVDWSLVSLDGWGATKPTLSLTQKPRQGGAWAGRNQPGPRSISMSGSIFAPSAGALRDAFDRLNAAISTAPTPLYVTEAGVTRYVVAQLSDDIIPDWEMPTVGTWSVGVQSADWRKFGSAVSGSTFLPSTSGGLLVGGAASTGSTFTPDQVNASAQSQGLMIAPNGSSGMYDVFNADGSPATVSSFAMSAVSGAALSVPFQIGAVTVTGQVSLTNTGNESGPVSLRIDGPCSGPVITHVSSGAQLVFSSALVLQAGEFLLVDMEARTALANGQSSRAGYITSRGWSAFDPGQNTWSFTASSFNPASRLTVTASPAWK